MAKKKRKHFIKLNNKIREIFNNSSFEDGITTLSDDELLELVLLLGIESDSLDRESAIKSLRRAWSEGEYIYRKAIVDHLSGKREIRIGSAQQVRMDKVDKILHILSDLEHSKEEENEILSSFMETNESKISHKKIENRLKYLRHTKRIENIEQNIGAEIDNEYRLNFMHKFLFALDDMDFSKQLLCTSGTIDFESLWSKSDDEIIKYLKNQKNSTIDEKQECINSFLQTYKKLENPLLTHTDATEALRKMHPDENPCCAHLHSEILEKIFKNINNNINTYESQDHIIIQESRTHQLFNRDIAYSVSVSYDKESLYCDIWRGVVPLFDEDLERKSREMIDGLDNHSDERYS